MIPGRAWKGRDKGGDEGFYIMIDINKYFIVDSKVYIMMTGLIDGGEVEMDYGEGMFYRTYFPTASLFVIADLLNPNLYSSSQISSNNAEYIRVDLSKSNRMCVRSRLISNGHTFVQAEACKIQFFLPELLRSFDAGTWSPLSRR